MIDKTRFAELMTAVGEYYGQDVSAPVLRLWWNALADYADDDVAEALQAHMTNTERGRWMPKISDVIERIDGGALTTDQVIAMARKPADALGVLCRIEIGSHNLNNWTARDLRPLAESCIAQIPEWKQRIRAGQLTDHERERLAHYGIDTKQLAAPVAALEGARCSG